MCDHELGNTVFSSSFCTVRPLVEENNFQPYGFFYIVYESGDLFCKCRDLLGSGATGRHGIHYYYKMIVRLWLLTMGSLSSCRLLAMIQLTLFFINPRPKK